MKKATTWILSTLLPTLCILFAVSTVHWSPSLVDEGYPSKYIELALARSSPQIYVPYLLLILTVWICRPGRGRIGIGLLACNVATGGACLYWDAVYYNKLVPWHSQGPIIDVGIWAQMALSLSVLAIVVRRRLINLRGKRKWHRGWSSEAV